MAHVPNGLIDKPGDRPCSLSGDVQRSSAVGLVDRPLVPADEIDDARLAADLGLHERLEKPVQAGRLQVPVGDQHPLPVGGENPGHVRERHRPSRSALERVERDDLADAGDCAAVTSGISHPLRILRRSGCIRPFGPPQAGPTGAIRARMHDYCDVESIAVRLPPPALGQWKRIHPAI